MKTEELIRRIEVIERLLAGYWNLDYDRYEPSQPIAAAMQLGCLKGELMIRQLIDGAAEMKQPTRGG